MHLVKLKHFFKTDSNLRQFVLFIFVGTNSAVLDLLLLYTLVEVFGVWYLLAASISIGLLSILAFFVHRKFTFRFTGNNLKLRYFIYLLTLFSGLILNLLLLYYLVEVFKFWYIYASILTKLLILFWNFLLNKFVTFREGTTPNVK